MQDLSFHSSGSFRAAAVGRGPPTASLFIGIMPMQAIKWYLSYS
jgi:hypothetical protein